MKKNNREVMCDVYSKRVRDNNGVRQRERERERVTEREREGGVEREREK